jgi:hypothetical protein
MTAPLSQGAGVANQSGAISRELHRWLQAVVQSVAAPFRGRQATGPVYIQAGSFGVQAKRLTLSGTQRATIDGDSRLVICG